MLFRFTAAQSRPFLSWSNSNSKPEKLHLDCVSVFFWQLHPLVCHTSSRVMIAWVQLSWASFKWMKNNKVVTTLFFRRFYNISRFSSLEEGLTRHFWRNLKDYHRSGFFASVNTLGRNFVNRVSFKIYDAGLPRRRLHCIVHFDESLALVDCSNELALNRLRCHYEEGPRRTVRVKRVGLRQATGLLKEGLNEKLMRK